MMINLNFTIDEIIDQLKLHEGMKTELYKDSVGIWTIGVGYNIQERGLPKDIIEMLLFKDIQNCITECGRMFKNFGEFSANRQKALIDMMFNLGYQRLNSFVNMRKAIANGDWAKAADEALNSKWAKQVGNRAKTIAKMLY